MNRKSQQEYIDSVRAKVAQLAQGMLDGSVDYLEGANRLSVLFHDAGVAADDEDFTVFSLISSETDALPMGASRQQWSATALHAHEPKIKQALAWARAMSHGHCESLVKRFGN